MKYGELRGQMNAAFVDLGGSEDETEVVVAFAGSAHGYRPVSAVGTSYGDDEDGNALLEILLEVEDEVETLRQNYERLREQHRALREAMQILSTPEEVAS